MTNSYLTLIKGKRVTFTYTGTSAVPSFKNVTSVSVIPFTREGKIVAVHLKHRGLDLPGGHVEPGETTPQQTMDREVMEEACITIKHPTLIEVIESDYFDTPSYMLIYGAFVNEFCEFATNDEEMSEGREIVSQEEFIDRYEAGNKQLMSVAIHAAWQKLKTNASEQIPVYTVHLPNYQITAPPDYKALGKIVDHALMANFSGKTIVARGIGSSEHSGKSVDDLIEIIRHKGTDRYDPTRKSDRYDNVQNKHIDLFGFRRKVAPRMQLFKDVIYGFYHSALGFHGKAVRIDILIIYDAAKLRAVAHHYEGGSQKRDGFIFKEPTKKIEAILGIIKIAG